jgi:hypothetical protein
MVKMIALISVFVFGLTQAMGIESMASKQILSSSEKNEVLELIDHACADSWCSGDYNYKFSAFSCNDTTSVCTLTFKIIDRDAKPGEPNSVSRRCLFTKISSVNDIIQGHNLNEEFYDKLNYCVSNRESGTREGK